MIFGYDIAYLLAGAVGGTVMGVIGTGSSLVILPVLILLFPYLLPAEHSLHFAVGTTLATLFVGAFSASVYCIKQGLYHKQLVLWLTPPLIAGSLVAPIISNYLPPHILKIYIAVCIFAIGLYNLCKKHQAHHTGKPYNLCFSMFFSFFNAIVSGVAGVAIGILMVPYLTRHIDFQQAKGTNIIFGMFYALFASIGYIWQGMQHTSTLELGYIYLPAFIFASITMLVFPVIGVKLTATVSPHKLKKLFYSFLMVVGIVIFVQAV